MRLSRRRIQPANHLATEEAPGVILIIPAIVWFVKVQGALNRYWAGKVPAAAAA